MKGTVEIAVAFVLLAASGAAAPQQPSAPAPASAQPATEPPQPAARPRLNLRLEDAERRRPITFGPEDGGKKKEAAARDLPGLGGKPSKSLEQAPVEVVPKSSNY